MPNILLQDILPIAQQEAYRMRHYYLGVEHLFIALLESRGSIAARVIEANGFSPEYVIDALRLKIGKGVLRQAFAEFPQTPRAQKVLKYAARFAQENQHTDTDERDLLLAILAERESLTARVLSALKLDIEALAVAAQTLSITKSILELPVKVEFAAEFAGDRHLDKAYMVVIKRMFHGYARVRIERQLAGGYTKARLYVITPIQMDNLQHTPVVVKIGRTADIQDEAQRYESHVKNTLPPFTARLEE
ncbi:MAG: hypothetical protein H7Y11_13790 [Armatimonadetes bacterium]|nr:hypothetical protein [Anaerolineae bacterium]